MVLPTETADTRILNYLRIEVDKGILITDNPSKNERISSI